MRLAFSGRLKSAGMNYQDTCLPVSHKWWRRQMWLILHKSLRQSRASLATLPTPLLSLVDPTPMPEREWFICIPFTLYTDKLGGRGGELLFNDVSFCFHKLRVWPLKSFLLFKEVVTFDISPSISPIRERNQWQRARGRERGKKCCERILLDTSGTRYLNV